MSSVRAAIRTLLLGETAITDIVGSRIYYGHLPQEPTLPAIVFFHSSAQASEIHHSGGVPIYHPYIQISLRGADPVVLETLSEAVKTLLHGYSGTVGGIDLSFVRLVGEYDISDPDLGEYHFPLEFSFNYKQGD